MYDFNMLDKLIQALRTCVDKGKDCLECPYYERCMNNTSGKLIVMVDAADAIEELSKRVASEIALEECWHRLENRPLPDIPEPPKGEK